MKEEIDTGRFEDLVENYYTALFGFAFALSGRPEEAIRLTQHAFWHCREECSFDEAKEAKIRLYAALYDEFVASQARQPRLPEPEGERSLIPFTIRQLSEPLLGPIAMFFTGGLSAREISEALDLSVDTVRERLLRGRAHLKQRLRVAPASELATTAS